MPAPAPRSSRRWTSPKLGAPRTALSSAPFTPRSKKSASCLRIFLRGPQSLVICPARGIDPFQLAKDWTEKFQRNEILILSPFPAIIRRPTKETAEERTRLVLDLAVQHTAIYADVGGSLDKLMKGWKNE